MKCLVIGGAGYIGSHVVKALQKNYSLTVFDNLSTGQTINLDMGQNCEFVQGDILDLDALDDLFQKGFDVVFHFAALKDAGASMKDIDRYALNNIGGSINILNMMVKYGVKNMVFSSSAAVYGSPEYVPMDEAHPLNPENFYGFTKLEIERLLEWYSKLKGINYAALRYFNAAGYGDIKGLEKNPSNLLPIVMEVASGKRKNIQVYGNDYDTPDGSCIRDYIHVLDLADAHLKAMDYILGKDGKAGRNLVVNLSSEKGYSVLELIKKTEELTGKKVSYDIVGRRAGDPAVVLASSKKALELLGWKAQHSSINEIIESMWNAYNRK